MAKKHRHTHTPSSSHSQKWNINIATMCFIKRPGDHTTRAWLISPTHCSQPGLIPRFLHVWSSGIYWRRPDKKTDLFHFWKEADCKAMHTMERIQSVLAKYTWIWVLMTERKHQIFKGMHLTMCVLASQKHRLWAQNKSTWWHCKAANHFY